MPKANIDLPNGTKVVIEGTIEEISNILKLYQTPTTLTQPQKEHKPKPSKPRSRKSNHGPKQYLMEIKDEGFFDKKRTLNDIQKKLEENGHILPQTHLGTPLRRLVKQKELRRIKEDGNWNYVKP